MVAQDVDEEPMDSTLMTDESVGLVRSPIHLLARTYGDSIVLRWAPEDYVSWKYLNRYGYDLYRVGEEGMIDTLFRGLKPLAKDDMLRKYVQEDSLAAMAAELTWGNGRMKYDQTRNYPGSMGALLEMSEEQNMMFGLAVLLSEWRTDLANDLAMRWVDRDVRKGEHYEYVLRPTVWDEDSTIIFQPGILEDVENTIYKPLPFEIEINDSLTSTYGLTLEWSLENYSSFEIERRDSINGWRRLNARPYVPFLNDGSDQTTALFADAVPTTGTYEYRIFAHDAFGELTEPSPIHKVKITDSDPPVPPLLKYIVIDRVKSEDRSVKSEEWDEKILAHIFWTKDSLEEDFIGYMPLYYNERVTGKEWKKLLDHPVASTDTTCVVDVTGLSTGMLVIAAYDRAGNMSASMPQQLRIEDLKAPEPPQNFRADVNENGTVKLTWTAPADDVAYYQLAFANDTTHTFMILNEGGIIDTTYTDTLALDVNQKYIYYKVRATDYSTNEGDWTPPLQVARPSLVPPSVAHLDTIWHDADGITMRWVAGREATMSHHLVYRQLKGDSSWQVIARCDADSVKLAGDMIEIFDNPPYNRTRRYRYAVESFNTQGLSSGKSLIYTVLHQGSILLKANIDLAGRYMPEENATRLSWSVKSEERSENPTDYYFSIYRKAAGDDLFRFVTTVSKGTTLYEDVLLKPGEKADYYVKMVCKDGQRSAPSNIVTIEAPLSSGMEGVSKGIHKE